MSAFQLSVSTRGSIHSVSEEMSQYASKIAKSGKEMLYLNVGAPATGAPKKALQAISKIMKHNILGYSPAQGIPELRQRISQMYHDDYLVNVSSDNIIITYGASSAFLFGFYALFDRGDHVAIPVPCYNSYLRILTSLGLQLELFPTKSENNLQPTVEDLQSLDERIKGLLVISPGNPTGSMIPPQQLQAIIKYCQQHGITLISDEVYHNLIYRSDLQQVSALEYSSELIVMNSFSKYYSMPGWRLGWMVVPDSIVDNIRSVARAFFVSPPAPSQYVALAAMDCQLELQSHIERYAENRQFLLDQMPNAGFDCFPSLDGAFYLYARVKDLREDSVDYCKAMIRDIGVVATPGTAFDPLNGHQYVRFSYSGDLNTIKKAVALLQSWDYIPVKK